VFALCGARATSGSRRRGGAADPRRLRPEGRRPPASRASDDGTLWLRARGRARRALHRCPSPLTRAPSPRCGTEPPPRTRPTFSAQTSRRNPAVIGCQNANVRILSSDPALVEGWGATPPSRIALGHTLSNPPLAFIRHRLQGLGCNPENGRLQPFANPRTAPRYLVDRSPTSSPET
jgi:hypothetical protein